jgi:hypothetical protein
LSSLTTTETWKRKSVALDSPLFAEIARHRSDLERAGEELAPSLTVPSSRRDVTLGTDLEEYARCAGCVPVVGAEGRPRPVQTGSKAFLSPRARPPSWQQHCSSPLEGRGLTHFPDQSPSEPPLACCAALLGVGQDLPPEVSTAPRCYRERRHLVRPSLRVASPRTRRPSALRSPPSSGR